MKPEPQEKTQDAQPGLLHPVVMRWWRVFFKCRPENRWRYCSDVVEAESAKSAKLSVKKTDYGMPIRGPLVAKQTCDLPATCWHPKQVAA